MKDDERALPATVLRDVNNLATLVGQANGRKRGADVRPRGKVRIGFAPRRPVQRHRTIEPEFVVVARFVCQRAPHIKSMTGDFAFNMSG